MTDTVGQQLLSALDEIDQLTGAKAALQQEIERLRELHDELYEESQHRLEMLQRQKTENERLEKLLHEAWAVMQPCPFRDRIHAALEQKP